MRAMTEYLLKQSDLESLPKVLRRSPYESEPPITVYYRKDVESKAIEVSPYTNLKSTVLSKNKGSSKQAAMVDGYSLSKICNNFTTHFVNIGVVMY